MKYDTGIDLNFDGHCDLCGKFVDGYGHHRVSKVFEFETKEIKPTYVDADKYLDSWDTFEICNRYLVENPYLNKSRFYGSKFWSDVKNYTSPEIADCDSGISINRFLRENILPYGGSMESIIKKAVQINVAIDDFELRSQLITFRGFSIDKNSSFCSELDCAYDKLSQHETHTIWDRGFVSTSLSFEYAKYRMNVGVGNAHICMAVVLNKGQKAMPLSKKSGTTFNDSEKEVLLQYNQDFEIVSVLRYRVSNEYYYNVVAVLKGEHKYEN